MFNYLLKIEYDGTNFVGWQSQKNGKSIQNSIEKALNKVLKTKIRIAGSGRTDKGVHALSQYANFKLKKKINEKKTFLNSVNHFLKKSCISILDVKTKNNNFHARFSAKLRTYEYLIINRQGNLSINRDRAWHVKKNINLKLLKKGAKILEGTHDFSIFRASSCSAKSPIKKMQLIKVSKTNTKIKIRFSSKSFLQNQVRSMVGCLKYLSTGKWSLADFKKAFKSKKRELCAPPAPACGLYLLNVKY
ncbi:tRNA pseudouridine(38-40) synthase TruA [Candidatus Pelagibacter bacterium]|jgi:tRNA pseudouridine38-40 synthase|nr:tRNA pseudouridine(38-40) synthase TruA [Candidatus Pelagibacter bacterium]